MRRKNAPQANVFLFVQIQTKNGMKKKKIKQMHGARHVPMHAN